MTYPNCIVCLTEESRHVPGGGRLVGMIGTRHGPQTCRAASRYPADPLGSRCCRVEHRASRVPRERHGHPLGHSSAHEVTNGTRDGDDSTRAVTAVATAATVLAPEAKGVTCPPEVASRWDSGGRRCLGVHTLLQLAQSRERCGPVTFLQPPGRFIYRQTVGVCALPAERSKGSSCLNISER